MSSQKDYYSDTRAEQEILAKTRQELLEIREMLINDKTNPN